MGMSPRLVLQFLGLPQLHLDDQPIATDRRKAIALLAYLAVNDIGHPPQKYSRESLSALFWPDYDQAKAFANLRRTIWEVHQAIGEGRLIAERESVQLDVDTQIDLDVACFENLLSKSRQQNEPALRIPLLVESTKLYRDHFLTGFNLKDAPNFNEWAFAQAEDLKHRLAGALTQLSEDHCALGQAEQAIPYARRLVTLDPLNESSHRQLMEIYLQAGQHSAALKQYQTLEQILRRELNLDPQPETRALYKKILKGEVKPVHVQKPVERITPKHNLPLQLSSFIGREKEQAEIINLITKHRLVTLTGVGGIGKTRLSIQVASTLLNNFPNGILLVELAPLSDPVLVPQVIVNTLGLIEQPDRSPLDILRDFLKSKRALLILDNCEHLIEACAQLAETLLRACPNLKILATSREALNIAGETIWVAPPLSLPEAQQPMWSDTLMQYDAIRLFVERAAATLPTFALTTQNSAVAIAQVCHKLDGLPLAIELAAVHVRALTVEQIAAHLERRFHLLTSGSRTAPPRHQTLKAMIDWSYNLLPAKHQLFFQRLSVFAGGWTLEAAETICSDDSIDASDVAVLLSYLVNDSLVVAQTQGELPRYHMLETIRQYAHEKLWAAGEGEIMRQRHLAYFVDLAQRAGPNLRALGTVMWLDRLDAEYDNIRAALDWAQESDVEAQLRLASALLWFWHIRGHKNEGIDWLERGLSIDAAERGDQPLTPSRVMTRGKALNASGILLSMYSKFEKAREQLEESLTLFQELGPEGKQGMAYALLGLSEMPDAGNRVRSLREQSLALFRELGDNFGTAESLQTLAFYAQDDDNDYEQARIFAEENLALRRQIGDQDGIAMALTILGNLAFRQEDYQRAITLFEESFAIWREIGNKWSIGWWLANLGDVFFWQGDYERAIKNYEETLAFAQQVGDQFSIARNYYRMGFIAWCQGHYGRATEMITDSLAVFRDVGHQRMVARSLHPLGDIALAQGDEERAAQCYEMELALGREIRLNESIIFALHGLGKVAWAQDDYDVAAKRFKEGLRMSREADLKYATFHSLYGLGRVAQSRGDYAAARALYSEALGIQKWQIGAFWYQWAWLKTYRSAVAYPLNTLAVIAAAQNQMRRTASLFGASETFYPPLRFEMSPQERAEHDQAIATARAALGEEAFIAAWGDGKEMTLDEAVAYALKED
jgi:predicted ATPase/DNA-binding SARP family transcriptional activator